jgi:hypothetical protein
MAFSPSDISGLKFWFKASTGVYSDAGTTPAVNGGPVQQWNDQSGGNHHATQATGSSQPLKDATTINGRPSILFDGVDDSLGLGNLTALFPSAGTLFVLFSPIAESQYDVVQTDNVSDSWWRFSDAATYIMVWKGTRVAGVAAGMPTTGNHYVSVHSGASRYAVYLDGTLVVNQAADFNAGLVYSIGGGDQVNRGFNGYISEVIAYDSDVSDANRALIQTYLTTPPAGAPANKLGLGLSLGL